MHTERQTPNPKLQIPIKSQYEKSQNSLDRSRNQTGADMTGIEHEDEDENEKFARRAKILQDSSTDGHEHSVVQNSCSFVAELFGLQPGRVEKFPD